MNINEKLQLIDQLSLRLRWLLQALSKAGYHEGLDVITFVYAELTRTGVSLGDFSVANLQQAIGIINSLEPFYKKDALKELTVEYDFVSECITLIVSDGPGPDKRLEGGELSRILAHIDETQIREAFAAHEIKFFQETATTPEDWRIQPAEVAAC
jgi:hypothetical protein